jgi:ligand-binding SRPBCC domain-containing protein
MRRRPYLSLMRIFTVEREQLLPGRPEEVFPFFADARNLEAITPPILRFEVVTPGAIPMRVGALIQYRLTLRGIGVNWLTSIQEWDPPHRFVDQQVRGPYALWHHTHEFAAAPGDGAATVMRDTVRYAIGFGPFGALAARAFVHRDVAAIFDFRQEAVVGALRGAADGREPVEDQVHAGQVAG